MDGDQAMGVGEFARRAGVSVSALHFYERKGLIEGWRTSGNQRRYPRRMLRKVAVIRIAQRAGLSLSVIKDYLDRFPQRPITIEEWNHLSRDWRDILDDRIASLQKLRNELDGCIGCGCLSLRDCPLRNPEDILAEKGSGACLLR